MNLSFNKLKSLQGIEYCGTLKFLNVGGNSLTSTKHLNNLNNLRELIISHN